MIMHLESCFFSFELTLCRVSNPFHIRVTAPVDATLFCRYARIVFDYIIVSIRASCIVLANPMIDEWIARRSRVSFVGLSDNEAFSIRAFSHAWISK